MRALYILRAYTALNLATHFPSNTAERQVWRLVLRKRKKHDQPRLMHICFNYNAVEKGRAHEKICSWNRTKHARCIDQPPKTCKTKAL